LLSFPIASDCASPSASCNLEVNFSGRIDNLLFLKRYVTHIAFIMSLHDIWG
jgi:hypothetical protein